MSRQDILLLWMTIEMHFLTLSYFDEFLLARHPLFRCKMKIAKVIGFGRCKMFYRARGGAIEFYTKVSYYEQCKEHVTKIFRSLDDEIGKEIVVAVEADGKLAVRYGKCNWYGEGYGAKKKGAPGLICSVCIYGFLYIIMTCWLIIEFEVAWKVYQIYILAVIIHYLFLPQIVEIRNYIWEKNKFEDLQG